MEINCNVVICGEVSILEGIFGGENFSDDICEEVVNIEGIFSVVIFTVGYEHCNHIEDSRVESVIDAY